MIKSMTGYGAFKNNNDDAQIYVEIKSLNSRYFDFYSKSCKTLSVYDDQVKNKIKDLCLRGNFQLKTKIFFLGQTSYSKINKERIQAYLKIKDDIVELNNGTDNLGLLSIDKLMSMPDIYEVDELENSINEKVIKELYLKCIDAAILELNNSRSLEGEKLQKSINENLDSLYQGLKKILDLHENNIDKQFDIYKDKIKQILEETDLDKNRLYQEIAIIVDKQDINEELVRLDSHLDVLKSYLSQEKEVGKKINFILQEISREINTITSKSSNIKITYEILNMKSQVEQIREQAQNVL